MRWQNRGAFRPTSRAALRSGFLVGTASGFLLLSSTVAGQCVLTELHSPTPGSGDFFGISLDGNVDELVVGARVSASVYARDTQGTPLDPTDDTWTLEDHLLSQDPALWDGFGAAVSLDGDHLIVGAPFWIGFGNSGAVFIFYRNDNGTPGQFSDDHWIEQAQFFGLEPTSTTDNFGGDVCLRGERAFVGAMGAKLPGQRSRNGLVYIFKRSESGTPSDPSDDTWSQETVLIAGGDVAFEKFGCALDVDGTNLLIGAYSADPLGAVYHFRLDDSGTPADPSDDHWIEHMKFGPPLGATLINLFGRSLDVEGDRALIGSNGEAYEFRLDDAGTPAEPANDVWTHVESLKAADTIPYDAFGKAVSLRGNLGAVGAPQHPVISTAYGAAYLFRKDNAGAPWTEVKKLTASPAGQTEFGCDVLLSSGYAAVGAHGDFPFLTTDQSDSASGSVSLYAIAETPWSFIDAALAGSTGTPCLLGAGTLLPTSDIVLALDHALPLSPVFVVVGLSAPAVPFKGGVLVPAPDYLVALNSDAAGAITLESQWPAGVPTGFPIHLQCWFVDSGTAAGYAASNAIRGDVP